MQAAVVPSRGLGDALLMMIASETYRKRGYAVTTFHPLLQQMNGWFPDHRIKGHCIDYSKFDLILLQNDNKTRIRHPNIITIYPTLEKKKHAPRPNDLIFTPNLPFASNLASLLSSSKETGLKPPPHLTHKKHPRICIHPTSHNPQDAYSKKYFIHIARTLKKRGYLVSLILAPYEIDSWAEFKKEFDIPHLPLITDLAAYLYESTALIGNDSGPGHLASLLSLPTHIIANDHKRMRLWQPDWTPPTLHTPPPWVLNLKGLRLRTKYWQHFVRPSKILSSFPSPQ